MDAYVPNRGGELPFSPEENKEYRFENVRYYNQKMHLEFNYRIRCRRVLGCGVVSLILLLYSAGRLALGPLYWIAVLYFLGMAAHCFSWPYRLERRWCKQMLNYNDGQALPTYVRFGERIDVEDSDSTFALEYRKIEKVIVLKHGLFLRYAGKSYIGVDPNCFTKGTFEEFKAFLREKRPDLKIPE